MINLENKKAVVVIHGPITEKRTVNLQKHKTYTAGEIVALANIDMEGCVICVEKDTGGLIHINPMTTVDSDEHLHIVRVR